MTTADSTPVSQEPWGYTHPQCRGSTAFLFFTSDLARTVNEHLAHGPLDDAALQRAQQAVDALVQRYIDIQAAPAAFAGQRIRLRLEAGQGAGAAPQVALEMSPDLEDQIIEAQRLAHQQAATRH
ncbi:hypothetical protein [Bordetella petrii]|uniref:Uncharacterized protein n=1 Tax=Bordetella petrii (strain ATCC BAA-461 / DSM 12804 / CCUG 43448 / CIP 107267 / Se-1111R) TaxID=340100 RepID=A9IQI7_BORPD|nr:hypothetical protein [Bordetella petrii]CAP43062.1 hypothetical protein predicted by Glimmer/Critica [Bordetella petrii]